MNIIENPIYVLSVLCAIVLTGFYLNRTRYGKKLGVAIIVILITAVMANLKLIPTASNKIPLYDAIFTYLAPISIFYLLLNVNLRSIMKAGTPMIILFLIGSLATTLGILMAWFLISPQEVIGEEANIIAAMLTGTYTGGSVNFNAIAIEYDFQEQGILYAGTIAVDNVVTTIWILITLSMPVVLGKWWPAKRVNVKSESSDVHNNDDMDLRSLIWMVFLGVFSFFISRAIADVFPVIPFILILTTIGIILAQTKFVSQLKGGHTLGLYLVYIFLAVIGAYCEINSVFALGEIGISLLVFASVAVLLHGIIIVLLGRVFYQDWDLIAIASQANIGGGTTAIALAETFEREELILPAILVGTLGNALGTYLGFLVLGIL